VVAAQNVLLKKLGFVGN
jgi:hypothetical protein